MEASSVGRLSVIVDTNILINFFKIGRLDLLKHLRSYRFLVPEEVYQEVTDPSQQADLDRAIQGGWIEKIQITDLEEIRACEVYKRRMGKGEAACLSVAVSRGWLIACDEGRKRLVHKKVLENLGQRFLLNTPGILLQAIREGLLMVEEADRIKDDLEQRCAFKMTFRSFRELLDE